MATTKKGKTSTPKQGTAKTTWYGLRSWYYPSGTTLKKAFDEQRESEPLSFYLHKETHDLYVEYFATAAARDRALNAGRTSSAEIAARNMGEMQIEDTDNVATYYRAET